MLPPRKIQELQETYGLISSLWSHSGKFWLPPSDWGAGVVLDVLCQLPASQYTVLVPHADIKLKILMPGFHIPSDPCWDLGNVRASFLVFTKSLEVDCPQPEKWPALGPCLLSFFSLSPVFQTTSHVRLHTWAFTCHYGKAPGKAGTVGTVPLWCYTVGSLPGAFGAGTCTSLKI